MLNIFGFIFIFLMTAGCKSSVSVEDSSAPCTPSKDNGSFNIEDARETSDYASVVFILSDISGAPAGSRFKCTGTIVGHNAVLTAGHCIRSSARTTYVMQTGSLRSAQEQLDVLSRAVTPREIITHGTSSHTSSAVTPEYMAEDMAVLLFADQTFKSTDITIPSLYKLERPERFAETIMVGFGKSSESDDPSKTSIKRVGPGFYLVEDAIAKGVVVTYTNEMDRQTLISNGIRKYSRLHQGDSGGPLLIRRDGRLDIVGVASSGGPANNGKAFFSAYVDLFTPRSLSLLTRASEAGASFTKPPEAVSSDIAQPSKAPSKKPSKKCVN